MKPAVMSDLETQLSPRTGEHVVSTLRGEVVDGPDRGKFVVGGDVVSVGTARDNALPVADFTVSRYHLDVSVRPGGILVSDLGSTNVPTSAPGGSSARSSRRGRCSSSAARRSASTMRCGAP